MVEEISSNDVKKNKGGRKGGRLFPRIGLKLATEYSQKLVGKTHTGPQTANVILPGVFGSATDAGKIRASALKQYGLMDGESTAYIASELAKTLIAAPEEERSPYLRKAFLNVDIFKQMFDTFQGDTSLSKARIRQRALGLKVHPDLGDECVKIFVESLVYASLGSDEGDSVSITPVSDMTSSSSTTNTEEPSQAALLAPEDQPHEKPGMSPPPPPSSGKAGVSVTLALDSSLDTDKLQKQLELLRRYGVI